MKWPLLITLLLFASSVVAQETTIQPGDTVHLRLTVVGDIRMFSNFYQVDRAGMIDLPDASSVKVAGLTCADAARVVDNNYLAKKLISYPGATVSIGAPEPFVGVEGEVKRPGQAAIRSDLTLLKVIDESGGFTASADQRAVRLVQAASGHIMICNVAKMIKQPELDLKIRAGDKIEVAASKP